MSVAKPRAEAVSITNAAAARSLDMEVRARRYLITMGVRTACFLAFLVVPGWWKVAALAGAALLPAFAVLFANNADHRPPPAAPVDDETTTLLALPPGEVITGTVEETR